MVINYEWLHGIEAPCGKCGQVGTYSSVSGRGVVCGHRSPGIGRWCSLGTLSPRKEQELRKAAVRRGRASERGAAPKKFGR